MLRYSLLLPCARWITRCGVSCIFIWHSFLSLFMDVNISLHHILCDIHIFLNGVFTIFIARHCGFDVFKKIIGRIHIFLPELNFSLLPCPWRRPLLTKILLMEFKVIIHETFPYHLLLYCWNAKRPLTSFKLPV